MYFLEKYVCSCTHIFLWPSQAFENGVFEPYSKSFTARSLYSLWISTLSVTTEEWCKLRSQSRFVLYAAQTNFLIIYPLPPPHTHTHTLSHPSGGSMCVSEALLFVTVSAVPLPAQGRYPMLTCLIVCVPSLLWQVHVHIVPREQGQPCQRMPLLCHRKNWPQLTVPRPKEWFES